MVSPISTVLSGLTTATDKLSKAANNIANNQNETLDRDIIDIRVAENDYKANLAVIKVAEELDRALLSTFDERV